jgi:hypothetical protein
MNSNPVTHRAWIALLVAAVAFALPLGTSDFQTYFSKERRMIAAGNEIVTALRVYRDGSSGTVKKFPLELNDLLRDPRMLAETRYLNIIPVESATQKQEWGVIRNKINQVIGVHNLSNESPTLLAKLFSFRYGQKYSDWTFTVE